MSSSQEFGKRPLLKLPQQFYPGVTKMVLDSSLRPEVKFLRARWELNRWGRVAPTPMFVAGLELGRNPPDVARHANQARCTHRTVQLIAIKPF